MRNVALFIFVFATGALAITPQETVMPSGFEQIHIGIDWRSVIALRSNVEIMNMMPKAGESLKPDPEKPRDALTENLSTGTFARVLYTFEKGILVAVMFGKDGSISSNERDEIIRRAAHGRGLPSTITLMEKRADHGVLTWQDATLHINVIVPRNATPSDKNFAALQIMEREYAERTKVLGVVGCSEEKKALTKEDKAVLASLTAEIEALLKAHETDAPSDVPPK